MKWAAELEKWCWGEKSRKASNSEVFALSKALSGKQEISCADMKKAVKDILSSQPGKQKAHNTKLNDRLRHFDKQAEQDLLNLFNQLKSKSEVISKTEKGTQRERIPENSTEKGAVDRSRNSAADSTLRKIASAIIEQLEEQFQDNENLKKLKRKTCYIKNFTELFKQILKVAEEIDDYVKEGIEPSAQAHKKDRIGGLSQQQRGTDSVPEDNFERFPLSDNEKQSFDGIMVEDLKETVEHAKQGILFIDQPTASLFENIMKLGIKRHTLEIKQPLTNEISQQNIKDMVDQLIELSIVSPTLSDTFLVNQERVAYQLAKEAFRNISKMLIHKPRMQTGTHDFGRRGVTALQLDRVERARTLTSRLAAMHTLRQGLSRRALYQSSALLDEEDLMDYASRKKVGYSIVIAMDISGAVQFGRRIQGVRKACMAFGYYLKKYHPRDRVTFVAYHEVQRQVSLAEVSRLKSINGTGKDIGGCLKQCMSILNRDPERVPAIVLIGDGLPVRGDQAGFYNFKQNNREVIERSYHAARLLRKNRILFTFLQFREDRHLWQEYADEAAHRITSEAKGLLYQIDDPATIAPSLIQTYRQLHIH